MKIRGRKPALDCSASLSSPSPSSSISSYSSSITAANSSASSQDSSNSRPYSSSHRWHGLDLLVKAIHQVTAGSVIGVPYIQRRVTTRRRRRCALNSEAFVFDGLSHRTTSMKVSDTGKKKKTTTMKQKMKKGKKGTSFPIAVVDSVLHSRSGPAGEIGL